RCWLGSTHGGVPPWSLPAPVTSSGSTCGCRATTKRCSWMSFPGSGADVGLLSPVTAGTTGERRTGDEAMLAALLRVEAALLRALVRGGIAPPRVEAAAETVRSTRFDARALALEATSGGNPVIPLVRGLREAVDDEVAEWVHHGATSQDIMDTALAVLSRDVATAVDADLARLAATLAE